jgi:hypothetical protein
MSPPGGKNESNIIFMWKSLPTVDIVLFLMLNDVKGAVIVRFVDIDGIINSHCLNILFRK